MDNNIFIHPHETIKQGLKKLDISAKKVLLVVDEKKMLLGALTDGDIRRAILKGMTLDEKIEGVYNPRPFFVYKSDFNPETIKETFIRERIELLPLLGQEKNVLEYITWDQIFKDTTNDRLAKEKIDVPVVIMAGGKGTRMAPFTSILPKPLIPIGEKTILELIIDEFREYGVDRFFLTINYRGEMIKAYFEGIVREYSIEYINEKEFLGTAGSLLLAKDNISDTFIVSNCDIIVKADYNEVLKFHQNNNAKLTILSSIQHHKIPYGVVDFQAGGKVTEIREKPEFTFSINTGVYILQKECLDYIPGGKIFHMTDLIEELIRKDKVVLTYPVNENDYVDIGQWEEYLKTVDKLKVF